MTAQELRRALDDLGMKSDSFARIFGVNPRTMKRMVGGKQDVPVWIPIVLRLLGLPGALPEARRAVANLLRHDTDHPERGEYPYQRGNHADD